MGKALIFDGITVTSPLETITISIPDEDVEKIVGFFETVSPEQESALKTLVTALKHDGIWNKLTYLMLPILTSNVGKAAQNVLLPSLTPQDTLSLPNWQLSNGVFTQVTGGTTGLTGKILNQDRMMTQSLAIGVAFDFNPEERPEGNISQSIIRVNNGMRIYVDTGAGFNYGKNAGGNSFGASNILSGSVDSQNLSYSLVKDDPTNSLNVATEAISDPITTSTTPSILLGGSAAVDYQSRFTGNLKLAWVSTMLNLTELVSAHTAFKTFIDTLENLSE